MKFWDFLGLSFIYGILIVGLMIVAVVLFNDIRDNIIYTKRWIAQKRLNRKVKNDE